MGIDVNLVNRGSTHAEDFVSLGELQRTPAVIPSKSPGENAVVAGATGASVGLYGDPPAPYPESPCDPAQAAYDEAVRTNEDVRIHNSNIEAAIADVELEARYVRALVTHVDAKGDGVLTYAEIQKLARDSNIDLVREAAQWMLGHPEVYESLPRKWTLIGGDTNVAATGFDDGGGIDSMAAMNHLAALAREVEGLKSHLRAEVPVPPNPSAVTAASPASGPVAGAGPTSRSSSAGAPGVSAMESAMTSLGSALDSLQAQIAAEAEKAASSDPAVSGPAQRKFQMLTAQLQQLTAMMNTLTTMMSNLAKLYSEMAMTSVRNMK